MPSILDMTSATATLGEVAAFTESFRQVFPRADQLRWFSVYVWGLLSTRGRRSIEAIARSLPVDAMPGTSPAQSLQHFLSRSVWDERRLLSQLRSRQQAIGEPGSVWVVHEVVFLKRGKRSVGVHRQYSRDHGKKANSQTAVLISQVGPSGYLPLNLRLYLPRGWLDQASPIQLAEVPELDRQSQSKESIGRKLLLELADERKVPAGIVLSNGFAASAELAETFERLGWRRQQNDQAVQRAEKGRDWLKDHLGLDHFEGRSWRGWHHHAASVITAYAYLASVEAA
jgi:SRSO17 transposase